MMTKKTQIIFPDLNKAHDSFDKEVVQIFLQCFRNIQFPRDDMRVMQAIERTADLTGNSDGLISKILVDNGLRACRECFPQEFLSHIDLLCLKKGRRTLSQKLKKSHSDLKDFWRFNGDNKFSFIQPVNTQSYCPPYVTV